MDNTDKTEKLFDYLSALAEGRYWLVNDQIVDQAENEDLTENGRITGKGLHFVERYRNSKT